MRLDHGVILPTTMIKEAIMKSRIVLLCSAFIALCGLGVAQKSNDVTVPAPALRRPQASRCIWRIALRATGKRERVMDLLPAH
jgi:hypothetical protein